MQQAPWIKRIELGTGACTSFSLTRDRPFVVAHVEREGGTFDERVVCDEGSWFCERANGRQWLMHGSVMSSGSALYIFMEYPEARHPELESALLTGSHEASSVYADWLEEQGDPFAATLKPELAKERGPAGLWFMEGLERSGRVRWTLRDGFVRTVEVAVMSEQVLEVLHQLCHLRACVALERVTIEAVALGGARWETVFGWSMWTDLRWPVSMKTLEFRTAKGREPSKEALALFSAKLRGLTVELD